jgi:hypothetical protein
MFNYMLSINDILIDRIKCIYYSKLDQSLNYLLLLVQFYKMNIF